MKSKTFGGNSSDSAWLLTPEALGEKLNLSARDVLKLARARKIPSIRINKRVIRFDPVKVQQALAKFERYEIGRR